MRIAVLTPKLRPPRASGRQWQARPSVAVFEPRLNLDTVGLAQGFDAVCPFVNDRLDATVVAKLAAEGVKLVTLRCAGYNGVDLAACRQHGIAVTRVPAYSPHAVAEHAFALLLAVVRRIHKSYTRVREMDFSLDGLVGFDLHGKTMGVLGAGRIGQSHDGHRPRLWHAGAGL